MARRKSNKGNFVTKQDSYKKGFIDGLTCFAWYRDGEMYVGTTGTTLKEAIEKVEYLCYFSPPQEND